MTWKVSPVCRRRIGPRASPLKVHVWRVSDVGDVGGLLGGREVCVARSRSWPAGAGSRVDGRRVVSRRSVAIAGPPVSSPVLSCVAAGRGAGEFKDVSGCARGLHVQGRPSCGDPGREPRRPEMTPGSSSFVSPPRAWRTPSRTPGHWRPSPEFVKTMMRRCRHLSNGWA